MTDRWCRSIVRATADPAMVQNQWLHGFNYNVEEWDAGGQHYETPAICRQLAHARAVFKAAIADKPTGKFMIRSRTRVVKRHPEGDW
jgi:hypothetical protein